MSATTLALLLAALVLAFVAAAFLHYRYWVRRLEIALDYDTVDLVETPDGAAIELRRLPRPEGAPAARSDLPPVLLVHGIAIDHRNHDVTPFTSLARHLAAAGRDCWLLTLRSALPVRRRVPVRFAAMARHDVPLAVREVLARTGAPHLDYIGFSMGGILLYAALGRTVDREHVRRVAIIGSPAVIRAPLRVLGLARHLPMAIVPTFPIRLGARMIAFLAERFPTPIHRVIYNPDNVERGVTGAILMTIQDVPGSLSWDFAHFTAGDGVVLFDEEPVTTTVAGNEHPVLFFAGGVDRIAPPDCVRAAYEAWGGREKRFVLLAREEGAAADYGHGDLAMGRHAIDDIFEPVRAHLGVTP